MTVQGIGEISVNLYGMLKPKLRQLMPKTIRRHRIWQGPIRGLYIVTSWHDYPGAIMGYTERPLLQWFASNVRSGETWLDVGAHYGYTSIALSRLVGTHGRVFAFEPMLATAGYLEQTKFLNRLKQLTVLPLGLGTASMCETMQFRGTRGMADSTLLHRQNGLSEAAWYYTILVARLDWLWPQICGERSEVHGIKIDVQGMEIAVLKGMVDLLRRCRPRLVVELHRNVDRDELLRLLESLGYRTCAIPIEPVKGEVFPKYLDDRSYAFQVES